MKTRLSKILFDKGWTEMELSRRTGLAQSYINRVKNSRVTPTVRTALKICLALGVAVEEAFIYEEKTYGVSRKPYFPSATGSTGRAGATTRARPVAALRSAGSSRPGAATANAGSSDS